MEYRLHREKFINRGHGTSFKAAVQEMDEYISDPSVSMKSIRSRFKNSTRFKKCFFSYSFHRNTVPMEM